MNALLADPIAVGAGVLLIVGASTWLGDRVDRVRASRRVAAQVVRVDVLDPESVKRWMESTAAQETVIKAVARGGLA